MRRVFNRFSRPESPDLESGILTLSQTSSMNGVYGSSLASTFLRDAAGGADSVDVITIGDSNTGYSYLGAGGGGGGWTRAWLRNMNAFGIQTYASPLMPLMANSGVTLTTQTVREESGSFTTLAGYFSNVLAPYTGVQRGSTAGPADVTNMAVPATTFLPHALTGFDYCYVASGASVQTFSQPNGTYPGGAEPSPALPTWNQPGTALRYRVTHVQSSTSGGSLNLTAYRVTSGSYFSLATASASTYNASGYVRTASDMAFTMPSTSPASAIIFGWNYIGFATGPAHVLYDCVYKVTKGCAVNQLHYGSGQSSATISGVITGSTASSRTFLRTYFSEIVARQIVAGGSGRVIIWINSGVNSAVGGYSFVGYMDAMIATLTAEWSAAGFDSSKLAFVVSATHPLDGYSSASEALLAEDRQWLNSWAPANRNVTALDLQQCLSGPQLTAAGYYTGAGVGEVHLTQDGYNAVMSIAMQKLLSKP
jgi:hypothetical protein